MAWAIMVYLIDVEDGGATRAVQRCSDFFICEDVLEAESAVP
jgi:hypothetical protein